MQQFKLRKETYVLASQMTCSLIRNKYQMVIDNAKNRIKLTIGTLNLARPKTLVLEIIYPNVDYNQPVSKGELDFSIPGVTLIEKAIDGTAINKYRLNFNEIQKLKEIFKR